MGYSFFYKHIVPTGLKRGGYTFFYKHIVPTGLKRGGYTFFYKYIVPTGLNTISDIENPLKFTPIGVIKHLPP